MSPATSLPRGLAAAACASGVAAASGQCVARWLPEFAGANLGQAWSTTVWDPDGPGPLPPMLVAGGDRGMAFWDGAAWHAWPVPLNPWAPIVEVFALGQTLYATDGLDHGRWDPVSQTWQWLPATGGDEPWVNAFGEYQGSLIALGYFTRAGSVGANCIARWNATAQAWEQLGDGLTASDPYAVTLFAQTTATYQGDLWVGGAFDHAGGAYAQNIARWDGSAWQPVGWGCNGSVGALVVHNGELIIGGGFTAAGSTPVNNLARWNGSTLRPLGAGVNNWASALASSGDDLFVGGGLTSAGGNPASRIARWNSTTETWSALGSGIQGDSVHSMGTYSGVVLASGPFWTAGGVACQGLAGWGCPTCYANCDASTTPPILNAADFVCFLNRFAVGDPYANCDHSTTPPALNVNDFMCFLNKFAAGCP